MTIRKLPTGVPGLDEILGGGVPEYSFNIVAGSPGVGKTTLAHQFLFANATIERPAIYFTVLGEPALKMLRYQQQYTFFDEEKVNSCIRFINLADTLLEEGLEGVAKQIFREMSANSPAFVVVDSFRSVARTVTPELQEVGLQAFVQRLAVQLTSWEATSFLVGEYADTEIRDNPIFTVADGILWLSQVTDRASVVRKLQVLKLRGQASIAGLHTLRISDAGVQAFPRTLGLTARKSKKPSQHRLSMGVLELDKMLGGGIPEGDSIVIAGSSGTGKSTLATQFIAAGLAAGEAGILAVFEERPDEYVSRAANFGLDLEAAHGKGALTVLYLRPLDLSVDEAMQEILDAVHKTNARRIVIDSLAGFELALAPSFRADFRESLYRMIAALTGAGVTVLSTVEVEESFSYLQLSSFAISFLADDLIRLRYVEIDGELRKVLFVVKMRGGNHSKVIREYEITADGLVVIGSDLRGYRGLITGVPTRVEDQPRGE